MTADPYIDLLERLFLQYEQVHSLRDIRDVFYRCRADLAGQIPPGSELELLERLSRHRLETFPRGKPTP